MLRRGKKSQRQSWSEGQILDIVRRMQYHNMLGTVSDLPLPSEARKYLDGKFEICRNRSQRVLLVEQVDDYMILLAIPNGKSECDFMVWRYSQKLSPPVKVPSHDDLAKSYNWLKSQDKIIDEYLINAVIKLLKYRWSVSNIISTYFSKISSELRVELEKFFVTLKWIGLQEDVNYPPPKYLGSKMTLAIYALLETGFDISELRKVIRF